MATPTLVLYGARNKASKRYMSTGSSACPTAYLTEGKARGKASGRCGTGNMEVVRWNITEEVLEISPAKKIAPPRGDVIKIVL